MLYFDQQLDILQKLKLPLFRSGADPESFGGGGVILN